MIVQKKRFHHPFALDLYGSSSFKIETIAKRKAGRSGHLNSARQRVRLHAACSIYGVAPDVVGELMRADDAGNDRAGMYSNTCSKFQISSFCDGFDRMNHV